MILAAIIFVFAISVIQAIDTQQTVRGIAAGFEEGNFIINALFGPKPKAAQIVLVNVATLVVLSLPAFFGGHNHNVGLWGLGMGLMSGLAARHIQAIYEWHKVGV